MSLVASPLLSPRLRAYLGFWRVVAILVVLLVIVPIILAAFARQILEPPNIRFTEKSQRYYRKLADACDKILVEHPLGTNQFISVSVTDPTLPKIITDLKPVIIRVEPECLWMMLISDSRAGFAVGWGPQQSDTNVWEMWSGGENVFTTDYTAKHNPLPNSTSVPISK